MVDIFHTGLAKEPGGIADTHDGTVRDPCTMVPHTLCLSTLSNNSKDMFSL